MPQTKRKRDDVATERRLWLECYEGRTACRPLPGKQTLLSPVPVVRHRFARNRLRVAAGFSYLVGLSCGGRGEKPRVSAGTSTGINLGSRSSLRYATLPQGILSRMWCNGEKKSPDASRGGSSGSLVRILAQEHTTCNSITLIRTYRLSLP